NDRNTPVATMVAVDAAAAPSRIVVRRRTVLTIRPTITFPRIPARENSAAIRPETQIASFPRRCRKYGCHAYQAHEKNPYDRHEYITSRRTARLFHPYVRPARPTFRISPTTPRRCGARGVNPMP